MKPQCNGSVGPLGGDGEGTVVRSRSSKLWSTMSEYRDQQEREPVERGADDVQRNWAQRRRDKIHNEIEANRRGEYTVPTWVLAGLLLLVVGGWLALILFT